MQHTGQVNPSPFALERFILPESCYVGDPPKTKVAHGSVGKPKTKSTFRRSRRYLGYLLCVAALLVLLSTNFGWLTLPCSFLQPLAAVGIVSDRNSNVICDMVPHLIVMKEGIKHVHLFVLSILPAFNFWTQNHQRPRWLERNFASWGGGASIISQLTSPTYGLPESTVWDKFLSKVFGYETQYLHINRPLVLLEDGLHIGQCWEFSGSRGQVGIRLSERISVSHIGIDYISPSLLAPGAIAKAPRNLTFWGLTSNITNFKADDVLPASHFLLRSYQNDPDIHPSNYFIRLTSSRYHIAAHDSWQEFTVNPAAAAIGRIKVVLMTVESNEGADTTCLYWIGIHGRSDNITEI